MNTSRLVARSFCALYGLHPVAEGACPEGTELIVLNRLDSLALIGTMALLPDVEALVDEDANDLHPQRMKELGIWSCSIRSAESMLAIVNMRLACGRSMLIDQQTWDALREHYDWRAPVVFASATLEASSTMSVRFAHGDALGPRFRGKRAPSQ
jgi:hypothetical protein